MIKARTFLKEAAEATNVEYEELPITQDIAIICLTLTAWHAMIMFSLMIVYEHIYWRKNFLKFMQPTLFLNRYIGVKKEKGGEAFMIDKIIKRAIRAAIESFPIDEEKKMEILRIMLGEKMMEEEKRDDTHKKMVSDPVRRGTFRCTGSARSKKQENHMQGNKVDI